jgi:NAD-specific glutamate dehydrogenase
MADDEEEALLQRYQGKVAEILAKRSLACSVVLNRITQQEQREVEEEGQNSRVTPGQLKYIKDIINKEPNADVSAIKDNLKNKDTPLLRMINAILEENSNQKLDELINLSDDEIIRKYKEIKNNTDNTNYSSGNGNNKQIEEGTNEGIGGNGN